ncbi:ribosomal protein L7/L12, partial [Streptomyces althioticus]
RDGKQVQAIKLYRETTGAGLREAKQAVDAMS